jgi:hypothetical protein
LRTAWDQWLALDAANAVQPFPSVWPVRTLRSDVEPANFVARLGLYSMDNGSPLAAGTWAAAKAAADAAASAAQALRAGERAAFCATRPPGHHAGPDFMGGYCFINNAAVCAQALRGGGARVAVLDVDYHHGNGTQAIFYDRADVLFCSIHGDPRTEYPFYLGHADETGAGAGQGCNLNLPLPARTGVADWFAALEQAWRASLATRRRAGGVAGPGHLRGRPDQHLPAADAGLHPPGPAPGARGLPTAFILEGGYAAAELGHNAAAVLAGFEGEHGTGRHVVIGAGVVGLAVARAWPWRARSAGAGGRGQLRHPDQRAQQRGHPRRHLLPGGLAQGAAVRAGAGCSTPTAPSAASPTGAAAS